jgi:hypothetical protein
MSIVPGVIASNIKKSSLLTGLLGNWNLNETTGTAMADSLGVNNLTLGGAGTVNNSGILGKAVYLNNNTTYTGYLKLPTNFSLNKFTGNSISVSMWILPAAAPTQLIDLWSLHNSGGGDRLYAQYDTTSKKIWFYCMPTTPAWNEYSTTDAITLSTTVWTHLGFSCGGIGTQLLIYVNGVQSATSIFTLGTAFAAVTGANDTFGNEFGSGAANALYGYIDDISIYNRALSAAEFGMLYNNGFGEQYPF